MEQILLNYGLPGVCILALALAYKAKDNKLDELQEKRVAEGREAVKALEQNTATLDTLTEVLKSSSKGNG